MFVLEYKLKGKDWQYKQIDEAIRTSQFVRNKALRYWMDGENINKYDLNKYSAVIAKEFSFVKELNSTARQASAERAWSAIARFYDNCQKQITGKKGYPKFKRNARSVEYKNSGWKLDPKTKKHITFTDKKGIGRLSLVGSRDIYYYQPSDIKRVRLIRRADGYYCQICMAVDVKIELKPTGKAVGLDLGLKYFYADSNGNTEPIPHFYRKAEKALNKANRKKSKKFPKGHKQSNNYHKARKGYARKHLRVSRQREECSKRMALRLIQSNDLIAYEDLNVSGMVKNHHLAKSIADAGWSLFRQWLEYFGTKYDKVTVAVPPHYTSVECSSCGHHVPKTLSTRTHFCPKCMWELARDLNAAINILLKALRTVGHTGTWEIDNFLNAWGDGTSTLAGEILSKQVLSMNQESPPSTK
jgi:putative transposase